MPKKERTEMKKESGLLHFGESYTSLILGIVVVVISTLLLLGFVNSKNANKLKNQNIPVEQIVQVTPGDDQKATESASVTSAPKATVSPSAKIAGTADTKAVKGSVYVVKEGDTLWAIAEKTYKSGYNWVDIARVNKLSNPDSVQAGAKLTLPKVESKLSTVDVPTVMTNDEQNNKTSIKVEQDKTAINKAPSQPQKITGAEYTVVKGDYLWSISIRAYGDGYQWTKIAQTNKLANPDLIYPGSKLKLPRGK